MQDHPPHSLPEIQVLISRYLDGIMEPDEQRQLEKLLDEHSAYRDELNRQQSLQSALRQTAQQQLKAIPEGGDGLWQNLARQLEADRDVELMDTDPEFICAYYDNEIPSHDPVFQAFERQLYRNAEANRLLADMGQVSEAVRQFGYRLEASCTLDISQAVMTAYKTEIGLSEEEPAVDPRQEMLSAYVDKELSGKQLIEATGLIENDPAARRTVQLYARLSERIQAVSEQLQQQAPDMWPAVKLRLEQEAAETAGAGKVVPFKKVLRFAVPASVAAILLILAVPAVQNPGSSLQLGSAMKNEGRMIAEAGSMPASELASVDNEADPRMREVNFSDSPLSGPMLEPALDTPAEDKVLRPAGAAGNEMAPGVAQGGAATGASDLPVMQPMLDPELAAPRAPMPAPAAKPQRDALSKKDGAGPSSEEYLFDALSQQMTSEEILALLGE